MAKKDKEHNDENYKPDDREVKPGIYRHYKDKLYRVLFTVLHSETLEKLVLYECLHENEKSHWWVRPIDHFFDTKEVEGKVVPRFELIEEFIEEDDCGCEDCDCGEGECEGCEGKEGCVCKCENCKNGCKCEEGEKCDVNCDCSCEFGECKCTCRCDWKEEKRCHCGRYGECRCSDGGHHGHDHEGHSHDEHGHDHHGHSHNHGDDEHGDHSHNDENDEKKDEN